MAKHINHERRVARASARIKQWSEQGQRFRLFHGGTNSTRPQESGDLKVLDVSGFKEVLTVDKKQRLAVVEPNVSMAELVAAVLPHGLLPLVVPEFPAITVGGAVQGGAGESGSFRWGCFHETCVEYELILGNGEVRTVSAKQDADLFWGTACSYGTLGVMTKITVKLQPAKPYVKLTYHRTGTSAQTIKLINELWGKPEVELLDAIQINQKTGVVMAGAYADKEDLPVARFLTNTTDWFHVHAANIARRQETYEELIPVTDYFFRYDRGAFWSWLQICKLFHVPYIRLTRWLLRRRAHTVSVYRYMHRTNASQLAIIQDLCLPADRAAQFVKFNDRQLQIYPLWFCPLLGRPGQPDELSPSNLGVERVLNIGLWGVYPVGYERFVQANRDIEDEVRALGGKKVLYAHAYYPEPEFWQIYDRPRYDRLRQKYQAEQVFPTIYDKVTVTKRLDCNYGRLVRGFVRSLLGFAD